MARELQFFIDGAWVDPAVPARAPVIDPSTGEAFTEIAMGSAADVDRAVAAARQAFPAFAATSVADRIALLQGIVEVYRRRREELARTLSREMGAPLQFALDSQVSAGEAHLVKTIEV